MVNSKHDTNPKNMSNHKYIVHTKNKNTTNTKNMANNNNNIDGNTKDLYLY